jgi:hypothetical protein
MPTYQDFGFLRGYWPKLAALGNDAARLVEASPVACVADCQNFCEWAADIVLDMSQLQLSSDATQMEKLDAMKISGIVPPDILQRFHNVRNAPSRSRSPLGSVDVARACVNDIVDIGRWIVRQSGPREAAPIRRSAPITATAPIRRTVVEEPNEYETPPEAPATETSSNTRRIAYVPEEPSDYEEPPAEERASRVSSRASRSASGHSLGTSPGGRSLFASGGGHGRRGNFPWQTVVAIVLVLVVLVGLVVLVTKLAGKKGGATPTPTPTPIVNTDPTVDPNAAASPTPEAPTGQTVALDGLTPTTTFSTLYKKKWTANSYNGNFSIHGRIYESGIGMFVKSADISDTQGSVTATYALDGHYTQFAFDLGADDKWSTGGEASHGTYKLEIYLDEATDPVYNSDFQNNAYDAQDQTVDVTGATTMRIKLTEKKGTDGTLNVVLGDAALTTAPGYTPPASADPSASPTASPSATPEP